MNVMITDQAFTVDLGGSQAFLKFHISRGRIYLDSTFTPEECRGKGVGTKMMEAAIEYARKKGLKIVPVCQFSVEYFKKHPEYKDLLG